MDNYNLQTEIQFALKWTNTEEKKVNFDQTEIIPYLEIGTNFNISY